MQVSLQQRATEILQAVDEMFRRLENWITQPIPEPVLPDNVALAIARAEDVCRAGDVPTRFVDLATVCIPMLVCQFEAYDRREHGKSQPNGAPGPAFWAAAKKARLARFDAEQASAAVRDPMANLRAQGVSDFQIAGEIYGRRGKGPFMTEDGIPDIALMNQECKEPGSVWKPGYIPPWEMEAVQARRKQHESKIAVYDRLQEGVKYEDPATVEELLREGAFIQQIENVKRVTREEVLAMAAKHGLKAVDGPGFAGSTMPTIEIDDDLDGDEFDDDGERESQTANVGDAKAESIRLFEESGGTRKANEIATEMRKAGYAVNTQTVAAILTHHKRAAAT
jgi:hypothetical protein